MNALHLERARQYATAARRRADLERWRETYQRIIATPARNGDEAVAKHQALELLEQARPAAPTPANRNIMRNYVIIRNT